MIDGKTTHVCFHYIEWRILGISIIRLKLQKRFKLKKSLPNIWFKVGGGSLLNSVVHVTIFF